MGNIKDFFDDYFNIDKIMRSKREYKQHMERVKALPEDYQYVFKKIQQCMWQFVAGPGYDMIEAQYGILELFEEGASEGKPVLDITGEDVAGFVEEVLKTTRTYNSDWKNKLNREITSKLG